VEPRLPQMSLMRRPNDGIILRIKNSRAPLHMLSLKSRMGNLFASTRSPDRG
jgi:hypothetical protein